MNAESDTIVVAQPTNRVSPVRLGREQDAGMALFPPGQLAGTQIQADWGQNDATKPDFIKNKPEIPSKPSDIGAASTSHGYETHAVGGSDEIDGTMLNVGGVSPYATTSIAGAIEDINTTVGDKADRSEIPAVPVKTVKRNGTALTPDENGAVDVEVPTGTAASMNVPATAAASASATEVVRGDDPRLSDERTPTKHYHDIGDIDAKNLFEGLLKRDSKGGISHYEAPEGLLKGDNKGDIVAAVAGTDYVAPSALGDAASKNVGTTAGTVAAGDHTHSGYAASSHTHTTSAITDFPTIPTVPTTVSSFTNDAGYTTEGKRNLLDYTSGTTLAPGTAVYRSSLASDGTFPTITATGIPTTAAYFQFELELAVPSTVPSTITGPTGWTWIDGHGLPDPADLSGGETIYISVRLDCTARTFLASVWRVA